eukprot:CCRYP_001367-RB/>CCRYP_001367-RB protein AED:0.13 eAED:0.13 QI:72/1/0.83/1/0.6/0.5/6/0/1635
MQIRQSLQHQHLRRAALEDGGGGPTKNAISMHGQPEMCDLMENCDRVEVVNFVKACDVSLKKQQNRVEVRGTAHQRQCDGHKNNEGLKSTEGELNHRMYNYKLQGKTETPENQWQDGQMQNGQDPRWQRRLNKGNRWSALTRDELMRELREEQEKLRQRLKKGNGWSELSREDLMREIRFEQEKLQQQVNKGNSWSQRSRDDLVQELRLEQEKLSEVEAHNPMANTTGMNSGRKPMMHWEQGLYSKNEIIEIPLNNINIEESPGSKKTPIDRNEVERINIHRGAYEYDHVESRVIDLLAFEQKCDYHYLAQTQLPCFRSPYDQVDAAMNQNIPKEPNYHENLFLSQSPNSYVEPSNDQIKLQNDQNFAEEQYQVESLLRELTNQEQTENDHDYSHLATSPGTSGKCLFELRQQFSTELTPLNSLGRVGHSNAFCDQPVADQNSAVDDLLLDLEAFKTNECDESIGFHSVGNLSASCNSLTSASLVSEDEDAVTLCEWITCQKLNASVEVQTKHYFERSLRILYSLLFKMIAPVVKNGSSEIEISINPKLIRVENIMVQHLLEEGETAFFIHASIDNDATLNKLATKYAAMKAFGIVAYEILMRGLGPPLSSFLSSTATTFEGAAQALLCIDDSANTIAPDAQRQDHAKRQRSVDGNQSSLTSAMIKGGVPYPLCRFVVDLLGGERSDGLLFRSDNSFQSFSDVITDLKQMMEKPDAFVHLNTSDQWRLAFGEKMHGRESEKKIIMDVASMVNCTASSNPALLPPQIDQQIIMVSGDSGSGKTRLVMETMKSLENQGWLFLSCKFDRIIHAEPLSNMANAFNDLLERCRGNSMCRRIRTQLKKFLQPGDISVLKKHVPCLIKYLKDSVSPTYELEVRKQQIQHVFRRLLGALSSAGQPIAFFLDDLQWVDAASVDLFLALVNASELDSACTRRKTNILLIGSYRDKEIHTELELVQLLDQLKRNSSVQVTNITLCGFDQDTLIGILSESLCVPPRRTKLLSEIILQKTEGLVIHVIEFIGRLTIERILNHSFVKGWEWEMEEIEACPISESVAELFTFKLKNLPPDVLLGLQICSVFGIQIEHRIINFVQDFDGDDSVDIIAGLKAVLDLGLVEMTRSSNVYKFSHDLIAQAAFDLIEDNERSQLLQKLVCALIKNASDANEIESVVFVAVDLINRITGDVITDPNERIMYAKMNSQAAKKALAVPDFGSAVKYSESGLSFLDVGHWETHHKLMLSIHETSIIARYRHFDGNHDVIKDRIHAVFQRAKSVDEEFKTRQVWIMLLGIASPLKATLESHALLERLGEPIDLSKYSSSHLCSELVRANVFFLEKRQQFSMMSPMADLNKRNAMKIMSSLMIYYHQRFSNIVGLVSARMVDMTIKYGYCEESVFAVASFAVTIARVVGDIDEGASWARMALSLLTRFRHNVNALLPPVYGAVYGLVLILTEPIQATLGPLLRGCSLAFDYGNIQFAVGNAELFVMRSFNSGKKINVLLGEIEVLAHKCAQHCQLPALQGVFAPLHHILRDLKGLDQQALAPLDYVYDTAVLQECAYVKKDLHNLDTQLMIHIAHSFMLGDMKKAQSLAEMFEDVFTKNHFVFNCVIIEFYAGLAACQFARETLEKGWEDKAEQVRFSMEK